MSTSYTFAQNESISPRQLYRLYVFNLLGVGTLVLPNNLAKLGKYAFISIALGVFMAWLFMWIVSEVREQKKSIYDRSFGKTAHAKMLIYDLIIAIYELSQAAFLAWIFVKLIRDSLIPDELFTVVLLVIMAVCAYALSGGVECRARVYEVVFFFVLIPLAAMLLFCLLYTSDAADDTPCDNGGMCLCAKWRSGVPGQGIRGSIFLCADTACCYAFVCDIGCEIRLSDD